MIYSGLLFPGILAGAAIVVRRPWRRSGLFVVLALSIVVCAFVFKSELRYRVPFDVVYIPLAVLGWSWVGARLRERLPVGKRARARRFQNAPRAESARDAGVASPS
jgi:hypothetical protein